MKVLVTGASGLVGGCVMEQLAQKGVYAVGTSRRAPENPPAGLHYEAADLADKEALLQVVERHGITHIIHGGGISHPLISLDSPHTILEANITGTANLLEIAVSRGIERFVYMSSGAVYGNSDAPQMDEDTSVCRPTSVYGVTKLASEGLCRVYRESHGLDTVSLRLCYIYGPGRYQPDLLRDLLQAAVEGKPQVEAQGGGQELEYLHVEDCARGVIQALETPGVGGEINIGSGVNTSLRQVAEIINRLYPQTQIHLTESQLGYDMLGPFRCQKAERLLGFQAKIPLEEGIRRYGRWLAGA